MSFAAEQWTRGPHHLAAVRVPGRAQRQRPVSRYCWHSLALALALASREAISWATARSLPTPTAPRANCRVTRFGRRGVRVSLERYLVGCGHL